jgi:3-deoxy-7-phosphoheptulonate synthase
MIVVMHVSSTEKDVDGVLNRLNELGLRGHPSRGAERTVIGVVGQVFPALADELGVLSGVEDVVRVSRAYKLPSREFHPEDTMINVRGVIIGQGSVVVMAGPCAVESEEQLMATARAVKAAGGHILRGGAYKPRTSPSAFRGLGEGGLRILAQAGAETGLPIISEVMDTREVELVARYADILQIGSRNMANYALLEEVGRVQKPVMLKRGMYARIDEWLGAAEYIMNQGNSQVMLCERGIRTFETETRNTMDINAIPVLKHLSHLPVIGDPSHATGRRYLVEPVALASLAAGADGLMVEVHPSPDHALSDGAQSITFESFQQLMGRVRNMAEAVGRSVASPI